MMLCTRVQSAHSCLRCAGNLGQNSMDLVKYFQNVEGAGSLPAGLNPATWMLQVGTWSCT